MDLPETENAPIQTQGHAQSSAEGSILESEEIRWRSKAGRHKTTIDAQRQLKVWREKYMTKYASAKERIAQLEDKFGDISKSFRETLKNKDQRIRALEVELAQTKDLLATRTKELSGAKSFLSTTDHLSEAEVLGIVRDINENIFQVAAKLTEEWEKDRPYISSRFKITDEEIDYYLQLYGPALTRHVLDRDPTAVTFLVQSRLCNLVTQTTSSWRSGYYEDLMILESIYQRLSTSEGQAVSAKWRSLTHTHLPEPLPRADIIADDVSKVLWLTGSFSSSARSSDFVKEVAFSGIETIERLAIRLESVFMIDIASSDMYLLFGTPGAEFDDTKMAEEFESDKASPRRKEDKVAGTTEVGVEKITCGKKGESLRAEILLKAKVVFEGDLTSESSTEMSDETADSSGG